MTSDEPKLWLLWLAFIAALVIIVLASTHATHAHWDPKYASADPVVRAWYEQAQLTEAAQKRLGFKGCCAHSDVVRTQFRVSHSGSTDQWWWLDGATWREVPADIIHWGESAPDGQPTLFAIGDGTPTCFYPGESGQ